MPVGMWKAIRYRVAEAGTAGVATSRRAELRVMTVSAAIRARALLRPPRVMTRGTNIAGVRHEADGSAVFMRIWVLAASMVVPKDSAVFRTVNRFSCNFCRENVLRQQ